MFSAGLSLHIRQEDRRQDSQTKAEGHRLRNSSQGCPAPISTQTSKDSTCHASHRRMLVSYAL